MKSNVKPSVRPTLRLWFGNAIIGMLAIYWIMLIAAPLTNLLSSVNPFSTTPAHITQTAWATPRTATMTRLLIVAFTIGMISAGWNYGRALASGARKWREICAPREAWRDWRQTALVAMWSRWVAAIFAGGLALYLCDPQAPWACALSLSSLALTLSVICSLSVGGILHWLWSRLIIASCIIVFLLYDVTAYDMLLKLPLPIQLLLGSSWPLFAGFVLQRWNVPGPLTRQPENSAPLHPSRFAVRHFKRYQPLSTAIRADNKWRGQWGLAFSMSIAFISSGNFAIHHVWGSKAGLPELVMLLLWVFYFNGMVCCRDLHWRRLLAPNGFVPGRLGWHIIQSTLVLVTALAIIIGLLYFSIDCFLLRETPRQYMAHLLKLGIVPLELVFAVCAAVALRGFKSPLLVGTLIGAIVCAACLVFVFYYRGAVFEKWFSIGPEYAAILTAGSAVAVALANRLWTKERLLPYLRSGATRSADSAILGRFFAWPGRTY